jgi:hypothetical protein
MTEYIQLFIYQQKNEILSVAFKDSLRTPAGKMASPVELLLNTVDLLTTGSRELSLTAVVIVTCGLD